MNYVDGKIAAGTITTVLSGLAAEQQQIVEALPDYLGMAVQVVTLLVGVATLVYTVMRISKLNKDD